MTAIPVLPELPAAALPFEPSAEAVEVTAGLFLVTLGSVEDAELESEHDGPSFEATMPFPMPANPLAPVLLGWFAGNETGEDAMEPPAAPAVTLLYPARSTDVSSLSDPLNESSPVELDLAFAIEVSEASSVVTPEQVEPQQELPATKSTPPLEKPVTNREPPQMSFAPREPDAAGGPIQRPAPRAGVARDPGGDLEPDTTESQSSAEPPNLPAPTQQERADRGEVTRVQIRETAGPEEPPDVRSLERVERIREMPAAASQPKIVMRIGGTPDRLQPPVDVVVAQRGPNLHFSVRSADLQLGTDMRTSLGELTERLEGLGFRAAPVQPMERSEPLREGAPPSSEWTDEGAPRGGTNGGEPRKQGRRDRDRWRNEMANLTSINRRAQ